MTGLKRELGLVPLAAIVFFNVSGGPYGVEDVVGSFGPGLALLLLAVTPVIWSLPVALAMSELAAAMPDEGGYVTWVRRAFGPFWSFQVGWWSWIDSFVDVAVYPALFVEYLKFWYPAMTPLERWLLAVAFIVALTALNVLGVRLTGGAAVALSVIALAPVAALAVVGLTTVRQAPWHPFVGSQHSLTTGLGLGLAVVMWNYSGWDTPSTCLGETRAPEHGFRRAMLLALPVIVISYVLARDGLMPSGLAAVHPRFGTPWVAVVVSAVLYAAFAVFSFKELIVLNVWLYSLSLLVELAAFVWLRLREPALARPWRVPGGLATASVVAGVPAALSLLAMATAGWLNTLAGVVAALTGPAAYAWWARSARQDSRR